MSTQTEKAIQNLTAGQNARTVLTVGVDMVIADPEQPRKTFDTEFIEGLAKSMDAQGQIQPAVVYDDGEQYVLVAGENRWRAAHLTEAKTIDIIVEENPNSAEDLRVLQMVENIQRQAFAPIDLANAYQRLLDSGNKEFNTLKKIGLAAGVSEATISRTLKILDLSDEARDLVKEGLSSVDAAIDLDEISKDDEEAAAKLAEEARDTGKLPRAKTRKVKSLLEKGPAKKSEPPKANDNHEPLRTKLNKALEALNNDDLNLTLTLLKESMTECLKIKDGSE